MRTLESDGPLELAVIVPTHQRREILLKMLAALRSQTLSRNRYEVVVVCDGCTDGTAEAARQALCRDGMLEGLRLTVLEQPRSGAAVARNRGVGASSAPLLLFLDDDMIADPGLLEIHRVRHAQRPGGILLGAIPVHPDSPRSFMTTGLARWAERRNAVLSDPESAIPLAEILTGHMSLSREIFSRLGGFDTRFTAGGSFGGEDLDLGWRAREHGIPIVYDPGAIARQVYRKTFLGLARDIRQAAAADVLMASTHSGVTASLLMGRTELLPVWERRLFRATLAHPSTCRILFAPVILLMDLAARLRLRSPFLETIHSLCRAHLYALGMLDANLEDGSGEEGRRTARNPCR